jgi:hypothetical protein
MRLRRAIGVVHDAVGEHRRREDSTSVGVAELRIATPDQPQFRRRQANDLQPRRVRAGRSALRSSGWLAPARRAVSSSGVQPTLRLACRRSPPRHTRPAGRIDRGRARAVVTKRHRIVTASACGTAFALVGPPREAILPTRAPRRRRPRAPAATPGTATPRRNHAGRAERRARLTEGLTPDERLDPGHRATVESPPRRARPPGTRRRVARYRAAFEAGVLDG